MKKNLLIILMMIIATTLIMSCEDETSFTSLRLEMDKGTRTLSPGESAMEISCYRIILTTPDGKEWGERLTYHSYCSFEDLFPGKWKITVYGMNSTRVDIASGEIEVDLKEGENNAAVDVNKLVGSGALEAKITWDSDAVESPTLNLFLAKQGEEELSLETPTLDKVKGEALLTLTNLASGSYTLRGELYSGQTLVGGFAEAIRISNTITTKGTIAIVKTGVVESTESITVSDMTSMPIDCSIEGVNQLVPVNGKINARLVINTKNLSMNQIDVNWYIDGILISNSAELEYTPTEKGLHRIDAVFSTSTVGSTGSATENFLVVKNIKDGMPYLATTVKSCDEFILSQSYVARFLPDGKIIVADNTEQTVTIIDRDDNGKLEYVQTPYSTLNITECNVHDIVATGSAEDSSSTVYLFCNDDPKIIALNYVSKSSLLSWIRTEDSLYDQSNMNLIRYLGPAELFRSKNGNIEYVFASASTKNHENVGLLMLSTEASSNQSFIVSNLVQRSMYVDGPIIELQADRASSTLTVVSSFAAVVYNLYNFNDSVVLEYIPVLYDGDNPTDRELFITGLNGRITNYESGNGFLLHEKGLITTTRIPGIETSIETSGSLTFLSVGVPVPFIEGSEDGEYFYIFDRYGKKLYMAQFEEKYGFDRNLGKDYITLDSNKYNAMEISSDGTKAIMTAAGELDSFLLLDIIR
ncbi:MAG: hypothetical protein J6R23_05735 [Spirochaetales bacterium]|nr:hypothetical protein [Spirochaetales bacterium]